MYVIKWLVFRQSVRLVIRMCFDIVNSKLNTEIYRHKFQHARVPYQNLYGETFEKIRV